MDKTLHNFRAPAALARHFLVMLFFSFLGWLWETVYVSYLAGELVDRGFFLAPVCPIYGNCLVLLYFLLGTPDRPQGLLRRFEKSHARYLVYLVFAGLIPTVVELVIGAFFHRVFGVWLWTYEANPYNFYGYICLYNSIFWAFGITLLMRVVYRPVHKLMHRLSDKAAVRIAVPILIWLGIDAVISFLLLILK